MALAAGSDPTSVAAAFFIKYGDLFGIVDPAHELAPESSGASEGLRFASFTQHEGSASVYGARLAMVFDADGRVAFVSGLFVPKLSGFSTSTSLTAKEAAAKATSNMATLYPASDLVTPLTAPAPRLIIYPFGSSPALAYSLLLGYTSELSGADNAAVSVEMDYVVDARSGEILDASDASRYQFTPGTPVVPLTASGKGEVPGQPTQYFPALETSAKSPPDFYMQALASPGVAPRFARQAVPDPPAGTVPPYVLTSSDPNSWDTSWNVAMPSNIGAFLNPGSTVDAYVNVGKADAWWQAHGRNGYDNHGGASGGILPSGYLDASLANLIGPDDAGFVNAHDQLEIIVHSTALAMANNARWDGIKGSIMVGQSPLLQCPSPTYAQSMDLEAMAHEYQHAVTSTTIAFIAGGQHGALNESFSDVFAQFIAHDTPGSNANCIYGLAWDPSNDECGHPPGIRNMVDPHQSGFNGPGNPPAQPDNVNDNPLATSTDVHILDGIPNKAWSLATFGGQDHTAPNVSISPSLALGWGGSEAIYVSFIQSRAVAPAAQFIDVAYALTGLASAQFGQDSQGETAVACAWYGVGVLSKSDLSSTLRIDPCSCNAPDAGTCDAGTDASPDVASPTPSGGVCVGLTNGQVFTCITYPPNQTADLEACTEQLEGTQAGITAQLAAACPPAGQPLGCCQYPMGAQGDGCYFATGDTSSDGDVAEEQMGLEGLCAFVGGTWSGSGAGGGEGSGSGSGSGHDAGTLDARARDSGTESGPPHC